MKLPSGEREQGLQLRDVGVDKGIKGEERGSLRRGFHHHSIWDLGIGGMTLGIIANRLLPTKGTLHVRLEPKRGSGRVVL